ACTSALPILVERERRAPARDLELAIDHRAVGDCDRVPRQAALHAGRPRNLELLPRDHVALDLARYDDVGGAQRALPDRVLGERDRAVDVAIALPGAAEDEPALAGQRPLEDRTGGHVGPRTRGRAGDT